jgi:hypothetical protein
MSDFGLQPREVWKQPGRLPAEGRPGSSENTSKPRRCLFLLLLGRLCICATCLAFGAQYLDYVIEVPIFLRAHVPTLFLA